MAVERFHKYRTPRPLKKSFRTISAWWANYSPDNDNNALIELAEDKLLADLLEIEKKEIDELYDLDINENGYGYLSIEEIISESVKESRAQNLEVETNAELDTETNEPSLHYSHSEGVHLISNFIAYAQSNPAIDKDSITILRRIKDIAENQD